LHYTVAAFWGGQKGSLLFWALIHCFFSAIVLFQNRTRNQELMPYVTATLMTIALFFLGLLCFITPPFERLSFIPAEGSDLNPLLQNYWMTIHPPALYLGFISASVPFAFALAALATGKLGDVWIRTTRRWALTSWFFLSVGNLLGGRWAYEVLGWGGYWAWDPVENASLMPWLLGTAFLHSVMIQEKKGMMKIWNMVLVIMTYTMAIFGTFLTRSGIVSSVHAFAQSSIGGYFLAFIIVALSGALYLMFDRLEYLKTENSLDSMASREASFMFNNLLFVAACFAVLWGTMLPVFSEWIQGSKITVNQPWFNRVGIPIGLGLLFLAGVGPLLAWHRSSVNALKRAFLAPASLGLAGGLVLFVWGIRNVSALITFTLAMFVSLTIFREFGKGAMARRSSTGESLPEALINLTLRNTRRYGGYVVHFGIVVLFIGFAGQAFDVDIQEEVSLGDVITFRQYDLRVENLLSERNANYETVKAVIGLYEHGEKVAVMYPERRFYIASEQPSTEPSIRSTLREDLYVIYAGASPDGTRAVLQVYLNPLVMWVWIGGIIMGLGTGIALLPNRRSAPSKRSRKEAEAKDAEEVHA
jgi:cytochrome c-type biogenesis protein CcmF